MSQLKHHSQSTVKTTSYQLKHHSQTWSVRLLLSSAWIHARNVSSVMKISAALANSTGASALIIYSHTTSTSQSQCIVVHTDQLYSDSTTFWTSCGGWLCHNCRVFIESCGVRVEWTGFEKYVSYGPPQQWTQNQSITFNDTTDIGYHPTQYTVHCLALITSSHSLHIHSSVQTPNHCVTTIRISFQ